MDKKKPNIDDSIPTFTRQYDEGSKKKRKFKEFKPMIIASISALVIGSVLGVIMLNMFKSIEDDLSQGDNLSPVIDASSENEEDKQENEQVDTTDAVTLQQVNAYVLQGGVYSEKGNADEWAKAFKQAGFPTMIWERDNQYFLFAGIAKSKEEAKKQATVIQEHTLDIFVKEWSTDEFELDLTKEENNWLQSFHEQWNKSLKLINETGFSINEWKDLTKEKPHETKKLSQLIETIQKSNDTQGHEAQVTMLDIWKNYELLAK